MSMVTTLTLTYEGPPSCADCQREGVVLCAHIGFNIEAWDYLLGVPVNGPGLDPAYVHTVRNVEISSDRKTIALTVETDRPGLLELARHLSTLTDHRIKAPVKAVHHETGVVLAEGRYDAWLQPGQQVYINGEPHVVQDIEHPNRNEYGSSGAKPDVQVARLVPTPIEPLQPVSGVSSNG